LFWPHIGPIIANNPVRIAGNKFHHDLMADSQEQLKQEGGNDEKTRFSEVRRGTGCYIGWSNPVSKQNQRRALL
jgi:hypothetical protein